MGLHPLVRYAKCSSAAYLTGAALVGALADLGLTLLDEHASADTDTQCFAALDRASGELVMGFRGTEDTSDALRDAEILVSALTCVRLPWTHLVHAGFLGGWESVSGWARKLWMDLKPDRLTVCGHSLGGALATLCAVDAFADIVTSVYTYGSPRVGLSSFASDYAKAGLQTTRVVHALDVVPRVPGLPYEHVCEGLWLDDTGTEVKAEGFWHRLVGDLTRQNLADHRIDTYVRACQGYADRSTPSPAPA